MSKIFVSGLSNVETSCFVNSFPVYYSPVEYPFFGISSAASGVGLNVSLALETLGDEVTFLTFVGDDPAGEIVRKSVEDSVSHPVLLPCRETASSVVLFDSFGKRKVYTDLKDIQKLSIESVALDSFEYYDAFCLCNINFSRYMLKKIKASGKPIFTDVHCISDIDDEYNRDFMSFSDVLFLSNENIIGREEDFSRSLMLRYHPSLIVVGMGDKGALLCTEKGFYFSKAVKNSNVKNTVGAGDALFSAVTHFYTKGYPAEKALDLACVFASHKIGFGSASQGFLTEKELLDRI